MISENIFSPLPSEQKTNFKLATIISVTENGATVQFDGEETASTKIYKCLSTYTPTANDRVLMAWFSGSGVILGKI